MLPNQFIGAEMGMANRLQSAWVATMLRLVHQGKINIGAR